MNGIINLKDPSEARGKTSIVEEPEVEKTPVLTTTSHGTAAGGMSPELTHLIEATEAVPKDEKTAESNIETLREENERLRKERIASMVGRTQGWVSTRLCLLNTLTPDLVELIRKGSISTWAAMRVIAPIARAIPEHGKVLSENLKKMPPPQGG